VAGIFFCCIWRFLEKAPVSLVAWNAVVISYVVAALFLLLAFGDKVLQRFRIWGTGLVVPLALLLMQLVNDNRDLMFTESIMALGVLVGVTGTILLEPRT